jgi:branched-chain amino acid transport system ATP-binding protein
VTVDAERSSPEDREVVPVLITEQLTCGYNAVPVVSDVNLTVHAGEVVALLGANGAGKTTLLMTLSGEIGPLSGRVLWDGKVVKEPLHRRARAGMGLVTEERSIFTKLSTADNIRVAGVPVERVLELFPELRNRLSIKAGLLSGGEQQMLTLGRALARLPRVLLADELSLGLAPLVIERLLAAVRRAAQEDGVGVVLVEQQVAEALEYADRAYVLGRGRVEIAGTVDEVRNAAAHIEAAYLGAEIGGEEDGEANM